MRKCYLCGQYYSFGEARCDYCHTALTPLDAFRPWRQMRRLLRQFRRPNGGRMRAL